MYKKEVESFVTKLFGYDQYSSHCSKKYDEVVELTYDSDSECYKSSCHWKKIPYRQEIALCVFVFTETNDRIIALLWEVASFWETDWSVNNIISELITSSSITQLYSYSQISCIDIRLAELCLKGFLALNVDCLGTYYLLSVISKSWYFLQIVFLNSAYNFISSQTNKHIESKQVKFHFGKQS